VARFDLMEQADDPARFMLYEVYRDAAAQAAHKETAHYRAWAAKTPTCSPRRARGSCTARSIRPTANGRGSDW